MVVVTTPQDKRTQALCAKYGVKCLQTEVFYAEGDTFNKARGINHGLAHLKTSNWILHLDADTILPPNFHRFLHGAELDKKFIYGMDRVNCVGRQKWEDYKREPELMFEWSWLVKPPMNMPLGGRIAHNEYGGYVPIGYFQLWHGEGSGITRYPTRQGSAEHTDVLHGVQWPRNKRILLPEAFCIHLETKSKTIDGMGPNWHGRKTPTFSLEEEPFISSPKPPKNDPGTEPIDHNEYYC